MRANQFRSSGYTEDIPNNLFGDNPIFIISTVPEKVYRWVNDKPTDEIEAYRMYFATEGTEEPIRVKFNKPIKEIPKFLSEVNLVGFEGIKIRSKYYFRAQGIEYV